MEALQKMSHCWQVQFLISWAMEFSLNFIARHEVSSGTYTFTVSGVATASNYILMVYVTAERLLNPNDQLLMGQVQSVLLNEVGDLRTHSCDV